MTRILRREPRRIALARESSATPRLARQARHLSWQTLAKVLSSLMMLLVAACTQRRSHQHQSCSHRGRHRSSQRSRCSTHGPSPCSVVRASSLSSRHHPRAPPLRPPGPVLRVGHPPPWLPRLSRRGLVRVHGHVRVLLARTVLVHRDRRLPLFRCGRGILRPCGSLPTCHLSRPLPGCRSPIWRQFPS